MLQEILSKSETNATKGVETLLAKAAGVEDIALVLKTDSEKLKEHKELYIGNVPANVTNAQFVDFLNRTIEYLHLNTSEGGPVINAWVSMEGQYAFVQFRSVDETNNALLLNGLPCLGQQLNVGRPKANVNAKGLPSAKSLANFIKNDGPAKLAELGVGGVDLDEKSIAAAAATDSSKNMNKEEQKDEKKNQDNDDDKNDLVITKVMRGLSEEIVKQIVSAFGTVASIRFLANEEKTSTESSNFEIVRLRYKNVQDNAKAIEGLQGFELGTQKLEIMTFEEAKQRDVVKAIEKKSREEAEEEEKTVVAVSASSRALEMSNMITEEDLVDDEEYEDIKLDVEDECNKTGRVVSLEIPRSGDGKGKIFVMFETSEGAQKTLESLSGKHFGGRTVVVNFFSEEKYVSKTWGGL